MASDERIPLADPAESSGKTRSGAHPAEPQPPLGKWVWDDRGDRKPIRPGRARALLGPQGAANLDDGETSGVDWSFTIPLIGCGVFVLAITCVFSGLIYTALSAMTREAPILTPILIGLAVAGGYVAFMFWRRRVAKRLGLSQMEVQSWLRMGEEGLCPSCGYALVGLAMADDGCRVCPECGAAWKHRRAKAPGTPPQSPPAPVQAPSAGGEP